MKTLINLTADCDETDFKETPIHPMTIGVNIDKTNFIAVRMTPAGLVVTNGKSNIAIPMDELISLAMRSEPDLAPSSPAASATPAMDSPHPAPHTSLPAK